MTDPQVPVPDPFAMWREWVAQSERQWNALLNQAMGTDQYGQSLARFMELYLGLQKSMGEAMGRYFTALNIPTRTDVLALGQRLSGIEERLAGLEASLERLGAARRTDGEGATTPARPRRTKTPPSTGESAL